MGRLRIAKTGMLDALNRQKSRMDVGERESRLMVGHYQGHSCPIVDIGVVLVEELEHSEPRDDTLGRIDCKRELRTGRSRACRVVVVYCSNIVRTFQRRCCE